MHTSERLIVTGLCILTLGGVAGGYLGSCFFYWESCSFASARGDWMFYQWYMVPAYACTAYLVGKRKTRQRKET